MEEGEAVEIIQEMAIKSVLNRAEMLCCLTSTRSWIAPGKCSFKD
jgi:hypothetical protein